MIKILIILLGFTFQVDELNTITEMQNKFESITNLQAEFKQSAGSTNFLLGKFYFKKENSYRIELPNNIIISDGKSIWNEDLKRNKVVISSVEEDPLAFSLAEYIYEYPKKCKVIEEKHNNGFLITLLPSDSNLNFKSAKLMINSDFLITKIDVIDFAGNKFVLKFSDIKTDVDLKDSFFVFEDSLNKKIIDIR